MNWGWNSEVRCGVAERTVHRSKWNIAHGCNTLMACVQMVAFSKQDVLFKRARLFWIIWPQDSDTFIDSLKSTRHLASGKSTVRTEGGKACCKHASHCQSGNDAMHIKISLAYGTALSPHSRHIVTDHIVNSCHTSEPMQPQLPLLQCYTRLKHLFAAQLRILPPCYLGAANVLILGTLQPNGRTTMLCCRCCH